MKGKMAFILFCLVFCAGSSRCDFLSRHKRILINIVFFMAHLHWILSFSHRRRMGACASPADPKIPAGAGGHHGEDGLW
jgi:hypothetical protein